jgi:hypothetical protein
MGTTLGRMALLSGILGVLTWRAAAFGRPSSLVSIPDDLRLPFAALGLVFLTSGVWARRARIDRHTAVFLVYGLGGGIHWGGAVGSSGAILDWVLFYAYLGPTALADAALLHLSLIYPRGPGLGGLARSALYAPAGIALAGATPVAAWPVGVREVVAGLVLLVANLYSLAAGLLFVWRALTLDRATRRAARLSLIAGSMVAGGGAALLGAAGALPGQPEAWNLALGVIPVCLAVALVTRTSRPDLPGTNAVPAVAARPHGH